MTDPVISVVDAGKCFRLYPNASARMRQLFARNGVRHYQEFWALRNISFDVARGERFGIVGRNGSGKTTLLQLLAGTLQPTTGSVEVRGSLTALLELGSGFHPDFTGRENVYLYGAVLGLNQAKIDSYIDAIEKFADLGEFFERPLKTYSAGMSVRLGFSVQACIDPEILIVDEVLSVGDYFFQQRCFAKLHELRERGVTMVVVTHDLSIVRDLCTRAMVLRSGENIFLGDSLLAVRTYVSGRQIAGTSDVPHVAAPVTHAAARSVAQWTAAPAESADARILAVSVVGSDDRPTYDVKIGERLRVRVLYDTGALGKGLHVGVVLKNRWDQMVNVTTSRGLGLSPPVSALREQLFEMEFDMCVEAGGYSFRVQLFGSEKEGDEKLDVTPWLGPITVHWNYEAEPPPFHGLFGIPVQGRYLGDA